MIFAPMSNSLNAVLQAKFIRLITPIRLIAAKSADQIYRALLRFFLKFSYFTISSTVTKRLNSRYFILNFTFRPQATFKFYQYLSVKF